jgi:hypothetical protein
MDDLTQLKESICEGKEAIIKLGFTLSDANEFYEGLELVAGIRKPSINDRILTAEATRRIIEA